MRCFSVFEGKIEQEAEVPNKNVVNRSLDGVNRHAWGVRTWETKAAFQEAETAGPCVCD